MCEKVEIVIEKEAYGHRKVESEITEFKCYRWGQEGGQIRMERKKVMLLPYTQTETEGNGGEQLKPT